jgi:hypothetical protein
MIKLGRKINYTIIIEPTMNGGFFVKVGCGKFSFTNSSDLILALLSYFENPEQHEKEYNNLNGCIRIQENSSTIDSEAVSEERPVPPIGRPVAYENNE